MITHFYRARVARAFSCAVTSMLLVLLFGSMAHATEGSLPVAKPMSRIDCTNAMQPKSSVANRYALLLFFDTTAIANIENLFSIVPETTTGVAQPGCWPDPDQKLAEHTRDKLPPLQVAGSCPTDCVHPLPLDTLSKAKLDGDPLAGTGNVWEIFFADGANQTPLNNAVADLDTKFRVVQILVKDSKHAGRVLYDLKNNSLSSKWFTADQGYRGQVMIGYKPPKE